MKYQDTLFDDGKAKQLEFDAPTSTAKPRALEENKNPDDKKHFKKHITLQTYGAEIMDSPGLDAWSSTVDEI